MMHPHESSARVCVYIQKQWASIRCRFVFVIFLCIYIFWWCWRVNYVYRWIKSDTDDRGCVGSLGHNNKKIYVTVQYEPIYVHITICRLYCVVTLPSNMIFHIFQMTYFLYYGHMHIFDLVLNFGINSCTRWGLHP